MQRNIPWTCLVAVGRNMHHCLQLRESALASLASHTSSDHLHVLVCITCSYHQRSPLPNSLRVTGIISDCDRRALFTPISRGLPLLKAHTQLLATVVHTHTCTHAHIHKSTQIFTQAHYKATSLTITSITMYRIGTGNL